MHGYNRNIQEKDKALGVTSPQAPGRVVHLGGVEPRHVDRDVDDGVLQVLVLQRLLDHVPATEKNWADTGFATEKRWVDYGRQTRTLISVEAARCTIGEAYWIIAPAILAWGMRIEFWGHILCSTDHNKGGAAMGAAMLANYQGKGKKEVSLQGRQ